MPTAAGGSEEVSILSGGGAIASVSVFVAVPFELSLTCTVKLPLPAVVGVPVRFPVPLKAMPAGKDPELTLHTYPPVPPLAASAC